jgi:hypothetical protein
MSEHSILTFGYGPNGSVYRILTLGYDIGVRHTTGFIFSVDADITMNSSIVVDISRDMSLDLDISRSMSTIFEINRNMSVEVIR